MPPCYKKESRGLQGIINTNPKCFTLLMPTSTRAFIQLQILIIDYILHKIPFSFDSVFFLFIFEPSSSLYPALAVVIAGF